MEISSLVAFSLFGKDNPLVDGRLSEKEWESLFDEAQRQGVTAIVYDALLGMPQSQRPPRSVFFHFTSVVQTIEADNRLIEEALQHFATVVADNLAIPTVVVKGVSLARRYPIPSHRERGDNDLFFGVDAERVDALMESLGIAVDRKDPRHSAFTFDDVDFENHRFLLYHHDDPGWKIMPFPGQESKLRCLTPEYEAFFLAKHAEHHAVFFHQPLRLRTLLDWTLIVSSRDFDYERLNEIKRGTDVEHFADLMTLYCHHLFGSIGIQENICRHIGENLASRGLCVDHFRKIYIECPSRHRYALVRVVRRGWKYLRYARVYRALYGQSMFRRFYLRNLFQALKNAI